MNKKLLNVSSMRLGSLLAVSVFGLCACAQLLPLDSLVASPSNVQKARDAGLGPLALGEFTPIVGTEDALVTEARYLKDGLAVELKAAGLLDGGAKAVVGAEMLDSQMRSGQGSLAARFTVTAADSGRVLYERELRISATWAPALGNVGTQWAAKEHMALYRKLIGQLFSDPAFRDATRG